jgi:hypothetical protein
MATIELFDILCADKDGAALALESAGCVIHPALQTHVDHPMIGTIHRMFGIVRNLALPDTAYAIGRKAVGAPDAEVVDGGRALAERLTRGLDDPDNARVARRLVDGELSYMPVNKSLAGGVRRAVGLRGAHIPFSFQALNLPLSMQVERHCSDYGFVVFYSEDARFDDATGIRLGRLFTTPFGVKGFGTWQEPISQAILDEDVGLILEANWLGAP